MTLPAFSVSLVSSAWAPAHTVLNRTDALLARVATRNAAAALYLEAARRIEWRCEESEFLVMSDTADVFRSRRTA